MRYVGDGLKVSAGKTKMMVLGEEEGLECEINVDGTRLEQVSRVQMEGIDGAECHMMVVSGRKVAGAIRFLHLECMRVSHEALLMPILLYGSKTMICRKGVI